MSDLPERPEDQEIIEDPLYLTDEQLAALSPDELNDYLALLETIASAWVLSRKQQQAEQLSQQVDVLLYGGAAGGGKSDWLLYHAYELSQKHTKHRTLFLRRTFPQLRDAVIRPSMEKFDRSIAKWRAADKEWVFPATESTIRFGFCDAEDDVRHYLSTEYDLVVFEELTEFTERQFLMVRSRNRASTRKRAQGIRPHTIGATNPGQVGHQWVKEFFIEATDYGGKIARETLEFQGRKREVTVGFVQAFVTDNPHIDPDYVFNLMQLPDTEQRQYLYGDWDVFEGMAFPEFKRDVHVIAAFEPPASWPRIRAIDYGYRAPYCCLWLAFDEDGNCYVYRERYQTGLTAPAQARQMIDSSTHTVNDRQEPEAIGVSLADPACWSTQGDGMSIAHQWKKEGLYARKAMNKRVDGWSRVRDWLAGDGTVEGGSYLRIMDCCPNLIRTFPQQMFDENKPEDIDTDLEDHAVDSLRYGLAHRAPRARKRPAGDPTGDIDRDLQRVIAEHRKGPRHPVLGRA